MKRNAVYLTTLLMALAYWFLVHRCPEEQPDKQSDVRGYIRLRIGGETYSSEDAKFVFSTSEGKYSLMSYREDTDDPAFFLSGPFPADERFSDREQMIGMRLNVDYSIQEDESPAIPDNNRKVFTAIDGSIRIDAFEDGFLKGAIQARFMKKPSEENSTPVEGQGYFDALYIQKES